MANYKFLTFILLALSSQAFSQVSLWTNSTTPQVAQTSADSSAVTLGMRFTSEVAGTVTGVRFYKGSRNTGTHVGNLWSSTGTRLATVTFTNETASGWQQMSFATPVPISANTVYVVSYHAPVGSYAINENFNWSSAVRTPLRASGTSAGVYAYGSTARFPNSSWRSSNYWVDVVFQPNSTTPSTFTISGSMSPSSLGAGAYVALSGGSTANTTANSSGVFMFSGIANGTYVVTPSKAGVVFTPTSRSVTVNGSNVTAVFSAASAATWTISGAVSPSSAGSGSTITLSGPVSRTMTANTSGAYSFTGLPNGSYTVSAAKAGYSISPASQTVSLNGGNGSANFTATSVTWTISGAAGRAGATMTLSGATGRTTTADSSGNYAFTGLANGSYVVAPSLAGYTFTPSSRSVNVSGSSVGNVSFSATATPRSITLSWTPSVSTGVSGYNVYRSGTRGGPYNRVNSSLVHGSGYTDGSVSSGQTYYYVATAVDGAANESEYSTEASATVPSL